MAAAVPRVAVTSESGCVRGSPGQQPASTAFAFIHHKLLISKQCSCTPGAWAVVIYSVCHLSYCATSWKFLEHLRSVLMLLQASFHSRRNLCAYRYYNKVLCRVVKLWLKTATITRNSLVSHTHRVTTVPRLHGNSPSP